MVYERPLRLAIKQEELYLELDDDSPLEEIEAMEVEIESEDDEVVEKEELKCEHCDFSSTIPMVFKRHTNSVRTCETCSEVFCGYRAKENFASHIKKHVPKIKVKHKCVHCEKEFEFKSVLKKHLVWSKCGLL